MKSWDTLNFLSSVCDIHTIQEYAAIFFFQRTSDLDLGGQSARFHVAQQLG